MPSTFFGLELGKRALIAQQLALDVTGHNIANASSPNYTRQVVNLVAPIPYTLNGYGRQLTLGTGVDLGSVTRARDTFVDKQYRTQIALNSYWTQKQDGLQKVEGIVNEPSDNSLHGDIDALWAAFGDLANNPENAGARTVVQERAVAVAQGFHQVISQIRTLKQDFQNAIEVDVDQVNVIAKQIGALNTQIKQAEVNGDNPNDLRDQRDALVDQLSQFFNITVVESKDPTFTDREVNTFTVKIGTQDLVNESTVNGISLVNNPPTVVGDIQWADGTSVLSGDKTGSIQGNFDMIAALDQLKGKYDLFAKGISDAINQIHKQGYALDGSAVAGNSWENFFVYDPADAADTIDLQADIKADATKIAAATTFATVAGTNTAADGKNAQLIASLKDSFSAVLSLKGTTDVFKANSFSDYYGSVISGLGVNTQEAERMVSAVGVLVTHLANQRQSLSGVSLDEEMTNLVQYQKSYTAAARIITMMDDMLDTVVNRMGMTR